MFIALFIVDNSIILVSYVCFCKNNNVYRIISLLLLFLFLFLLLIVVLKDNNNKVCENKE